MQDSIGSRDRATTTIRHFGACLNCGHSPEHLVSQDAEYPVRVAHRTPTCPFMFETHQETMELALTAWQGSRARSYTAQRRAA